MSYVLRHAQPEDMLSLHRFHREQCARDGVDYPLPEIFDEEGRQDPTIPMALVLVEGDEVKGALLFEAKGLEMMLIGCSPKLTAVVKQEQNGIIYTLRSLGYRWIRTLVTRKRLPMLRESLRQAYFRRDDIDFASFFLDFDQRDRAIQKEQES